MHEAGVAHRDLKPENILLGEGYRFKICDLGLSTTNSRSSSVHGTQTYMAPEIRKGDEYDTRKADIWSFGVVLFIMVAGHPPFMRADSSDPYFSFLLKGKVSEFWTMQEGFHSSENFFGPELKALLSSCLLSPS